VEAWRNFSAAQTAAAAAAAWAYDPALVSYPYGARCMGAIPRCSLIICQLRLQLVQVTAVSRDELSLPITDTQALGFLEPVFCCSC